MKTTAKEEQIQTIKAALAKLYVQPFGFESSDTRRNAQGNLRGRTHYVDDDTLRWHKSRVVQAEAICSGLLFRIVCSDALDMNNTRRGFRAVVFDVFGTTIYRKSLDEAFSTSRAALKDSQAQEIDLVAHYREAIERNLKDNVDTTERQREALAMLQAQQKQVAA